MLQKLNQHIADNHLAFNQWIEEMRGDNAWPIYHSLDMRISKHKAVHVDSNLFPGGFHHLSKESIQIATNLIGNRLNALYINKILLIIENFTRNSAYLENVIALKNILQNATNAQVIISAPDIIQTVKTDGYDIILEPMIRDRKQVFVMIDDKQWIPDFILINNDMTVEAPAILEGCSQLVEPTLTNGWYYRKKSEHFDKYNALILKLAQHFKIPHWPFTIHHSHCNDLNFKEKIGLDRLYNQANQVLSNIKLEYTENNIQDIPYLFIKANKGTFGMGIISLNNPDILLNINKKMRHSLDKIKQGVVNNEVLIQEGVRTAQTFNEFPAETMLYSVNGEIAGEIVRYNTVKDSIGNLNSNGMRFAGLDSFDLQGELGYIKWLVNKIANLSCV